MRGTITTSGLQPQSHRRPDCFAGPNSDSVWDHARIEQLSSYVDSKLVTAQAHGFVWPSSEELGGLGVCKAQGFEAQICDVDSKGQSNSSQPALQGCLKNGKKRRVDLAKIRAHSGRGSESWQGAVRQRGAALGRPQAGCSSWCCTEQRHFPGTCVLVIVWAGCV